MSADIAVRAEGISKIFRIGIQDKTPDSLVSMLGNLLRSPLTNYRKYRSLYRFDDVAPDTSVRSDVIWALHDVSFEVRQGEVLGIIGRNGAGKSTLLKILTRITPPTRGQIEIHGRVSSLLEVGTGFHRELTGRENIYLNGTILGMKKREVEAKFDEIVAFSGIERFLDTPVKRYSSGMAVRLAFSVAAHLEPEILIIDEVLAVGDAEFQKKCINKMQDVGRAGRTVLFVSHNMPAVSMLCQRAILLNSGQKMRDGSAHDVVAAYLNADSGVPAAREWTPETAPGTEVARLYSVRAVTRQRRSATTFDMRQEIGLEMTFEVLTPGLGLMPHYWIYNEEGAIVFSTISQDPLWAGRPYPRGRYTATAWIPSNLMNQGLFFVTCTLVTRVPEVCVFDEPQVIAFTVADNMGPGSARGDWAGEMPGAVRPLLKWETRLHQDLRAVQESSL